MKNATAHAKKLTTLINRLKKSRTTAPPEGNPLTVYVNAFLRWNATTKLADAAHERLMEVFVDINELRVSHPREVVQLLGEDYPQAEERAARLHESLQEVFMREYAVSLDSLESKPKKEVRTYLSSLPGMVPYVSAMVTLVGFGGHAIPIDDHLADLLRAEGVVEEDATIDDIVSFAERHIRADDALDAHAALQAWSDDKLTRSLAARKTASKRSRSKAPASEDKPAKKSTTKKSTQKKPATKKTTKKKTTTRKTTRKKAAKKPTTKKTTKKSTRKKSGKK